MAKNLEHFHVLFPEISLRLKLFHLFLRCYDQVVIIHPIPLQNHRLILI